MLKQFKKIGIVVYNIAGLVGLVGFCFGLYSTNITIIMVSYVVLVLGLSIDLVR